MNQRDIKNGDAIFMSADGTVVLKEACLIGHSPTTREIDLGSLQGIEEHLNDRMIEAIKLLENESNSLMMSHERIGELELAAEYADAISMFYAVRAKNLKQKSDWARELVSRCRRESFVTRWIKKSFR